LIILCHAFPDTDGDGTIDQNTTTPVVGVLRTDGTDLTPLTAQGEGAAYAASFSPDERHIAFSYAETDTDGDGALTIQDTAHLAIKELGQIDPLNPLPRQMASNSRVRVLTRNNDFSVEKPSFLSNDAIVFTGINPIDGRTTVYLYNISSEVLTPLAPVGAQTRNPAISNDGRQIAVEVTTLTESYDAVYDVEARTWSRLPSTSVADKSFAWSINGTLAIAMTDGLMWQLHVLDGTGLHKLVEVPQRISGLDFSPDGKMIAYMWDYDGPPGNVLSVATLDGGYNASVTSPDSDVIDYDWIPGY
jgi:Tol biopolymer transport system component